MTVKEQLHQAVDTVSDEQGAALIETIRRQFGERLAAASLDDEDETDEERAAVEEARADLAAGRLVPWRTAATRPWKTRQMGGRRMRDTQQTSSHICSV